MVTAFLRIPPFPGHRSDPLDCYVKKESAATFGVTDPICLRAETCCWRPPRANRRSKCSKLRGRRACSVAVS